MKTIIFSLVTVALLACGKQTEAPIEAVPNVTTDNNAPVTTAAAPAEDNTVTLTVYSKSRTEAPVSGWPTKQYTSTGYCAVYTGKTYCWDDGVKSLSWTDLSGNYHGPYTYAYFNMSVRVAAPGYQLTSGTLTTDLMVNPRYISANLLTRMAAGSVDAVLNTGAATQVSCTEDSGELDCGDFVIDTNQTAL